MTAHDVERILPADAPEAADWQRRVVGRSLRTARQRSIDRGAALIHAAAALLERSNGEGFTVQDVADEAGQSLRTLYQYFESKDDLLLAVFEEAMAAYATLVRGTLVDLHDPLDRLAGALIALVRLPERSGTGVKAALARLRLKLAEVEPARIGRAQLPVTSMLGELLDAAGAAGALAPVHRDDATFLVLALNTATITSATLGNDVGPRQPDVLEHVAFCLRGLGASLDADRLLRIDARLRLPRGALRLSPPRPG